MVSHPVWGSRKGPGNRTTGCIGDSRLHPGDRVRGWFARSGGGGSRRKGAQGAAGWGPRRRFPGKMTPEAGTFLAAHTDGLPRDPEGSRGWRGRADEEGRRATGAQQKAFRSPDPSRSGEWKASFRPRGAGRSRGLSLMGSEARPCPRDGREDERVTHRAGSPSLPISAMSRCSVTAMLSGYLSP